MGYLDYAGRGLLVCLRLTSCSYGGLGCVGTYVAWKVEVGWKGGRLCRLKGGVGMKQGIHLLDGETSTIRLASF
jgi:hypothetical protein